jgi:hypothetical protein
MTKNPPAGERVSYAKRALEAPEFVDEAPAWARRLILDAALPGELQLLDSRGGGEGRDSFPEEGAPRSSGFNRAATSERRPAFSGGADPLDDDIPF